MPSEPRAELTLEELSAYFDRELDAAAQARVAEHVAGCAECKRRLDGLRETVYAVRALPMETPPRTFTVPAQRRQSFRWAPVGWLGGAAAALVIVAAGINQLHGPASSSTASTSQGGAQYRAAAPAARSAEIAPLDQSTPSGVAALADQSFAYSTTVLDPRNPSRSMTVGTGARSYSASGVFSLRVRTMGLTASEASSVRLLLTRDAGPGGYSVRLGPPSKESTFPFNYDAAYSIAQMQLQPWVPGSYTLVAEIDLGDGSALVARLPLTITP